MSKGMLGLLVKKQLGEAFSFLKKDKKSFDVVGILLSLFLVGVIVAVFVYVFQKFIVIYSAVRINRVSDVPSRQFELLTVVYGLLFLFGVFSGVKAVNFNIFESDDLKILVYLPIKSQTLFASKLVGVYLTQVFNTALIVLPVNLTFGIVTAQSAYYVFMSVLLCFTLPIATLSVAAILALPYYYLRQKVQSKYVLTLITITVITGLLCYFYSVILDFIKHLLMTGEIKSFFNAATMDTVKALTRILYPANLFAGILLKQRAGASLAILLAIVAVTATAGLFTVRAMFVRVSQERVSGKGKSLYRPKTRYRSHTVIGGLIAKEFSTVLRTPSYAFQYFSTAIIMPLMVYFCLPIGSSLLNGLIAGSSGFELSMFIIILFSVLTNTFCSTNVSRDGGMFYTMKTLPFTHRQIVFSKVIFCGIVSGAAIIASCVMVFIMGYLSFGEMTYAMLITLLLGFAQICFATRMDFNRPHFSNEPDGEIKESNKTVSTMIVVGLIVSFLIGGSMLFFSLTDGIERFATADRATSMLISGLFPLSLSGAALAYLLVGLKKKYYEISEG